MKALILSAHEDTGGVGIALKRAMERHTDWEVRFVHRFYNYIQYPTDLYWELGKPKPSGLDDLFRAADVIHIVERWGAVMPFEGWQRKPLVMHHHGSEFRVHNTANLLVEVPKYGAYGIVSTPDLLLIDPTLEWLPNPCDIDRMRRIRRTNFEPRWPLRVAHSPTDRGLKATDSFLAAIEGTELDADVIEWTDWESCLARKARADIFYDQLHIGYALSGIEAMAMGIPVIAGAYDRRIIDLMLSLFDYLPFLMATKETLHERIEHMKDPATRKVVAAVGTHHVERWHAEAVVAKQLATIYEKAMAMR
jgi:glycosyltransferase involved in cell wall biosynthesis